jgi:hypothetical protein
MRQAKLVFAAPDLTTRYLVLGTPPLAKCSLQFKILRGSMLKRGESAHGERSAKTLEASAACAAMVANKIGLAVFGCATCVRQRLEMQLFSVANMHFLRAVWR